MRTSYRYQNYGLWRIIGKNQFVVFDRNVFLPVGIAMPIPMNWFCKIDVCVESVCSVHNEIKMMM